MTLPWVVDVPRPPAPEGWDKDITTNNKDPNTINLNYSQGYLLLSTLVYSVPVLFLFFLPVFIECCFSLRYPHLCLVLSSLAPGPGGLG